MPQSTKKSIFYLTKWQNVYICGLYLRAASNDIENWTILLRLVFESGFNSRAASISEFTVSLI